MKYSGANSTVAMEKASIFNSLRSALSLNISPSSQFHLLLLCSLISLAIGSVSAVSVGAQEPNYQVIVKGKVSRPNLQVGSKGAFVSELQAALKLLNFYSGEVNGVYDKNTANAVSSFQVAAGLSPNGIVDNNTWQTLFPIPPAGESASGNNNSDFPVPSEVATIRGNEIGSEEVNQNISTRPEPRPVTSPKKEPATKTPSRSQKPTSSSTKKPPSSQIISSSKKPGIQYTAQGFPILRLGMRGAEVLKLQKQLKRLGFLKTSIDGDFGSLTETAVKALQKRYGLEADGVVGGATWQIINRQIRR